MNNKFGLDYLININLINSIENYGIIDKHSINNSHLVCVKSDFPWYHLDVNNKEDLIKLLSYFDSGIYYFASVSPKYLEIFNNIGKIDWIFTSVQFYIKKEIKFLQNIPLPSIPIHLSSFIYENSDYKEFTSIDYIEHRIQQGVSSIFYKDGEPAGWSLTHDDGAIGFLHVLEKFRKRGIAQLITIDMINKVKSTEKIPFVYIKEENYKSLSLVKKLGFIEQKKIAWLKITI